jgi:hypothetical protein
MGNHQRDQKKTKLGGNQMLILDWLHLSTSDSEFLWTRFLNYIDIFNV